MRPTQGYQKMAVLLKIFLKLNSPTAPYPLICMRTTPKLGCRSKAAPDLNVLFISIKPLFTDLPSSGSFFW
jgi:hypothetical protein